MILGLSAPANPAFMTPVPLSITLRQMRMDKRGEKRDEEKRGEERRADIGWFPRAS
jgi:hypothetical protein